MKGRVSSFEDLPTHAALAGSTRRVVRAGSKREFLFRQPSQWLPGLSLDDNALPKTVPKVTSGTTASKRKTARRSSSIRRQTRIFDDPTITQGYASVPLLDMVRLPRGGVSIETKAAGSIQLGIPPETIKDSMRLGLEVPRVYIVPLERFCREMGPALGVNLAEFEFPAYFNYFVRRKKCVLVVDSDEAEENIRNVFEETLLGPRQFRTGESSIGHEPEDFDPSFPMDARPDFSKEFQHFRVAEKTAESSELTTDMLLEFCHFQATNRQSFGDNEMNSCNIGLPPVLAGCELEEDEDEQVRDFNVSFSHFGTDGSSRFSKGSLSGRLSRSQTLNHVIESDDNILDDMLVPEAETKPEMVRRGSAHSHGSLFSVSSAFDEDRPRSSWLFSQVKWLGEVATVWPMSASETQIKERSVPRVEIFKMPGGTEYIIHDVDEDNVIVGKSRFSGAVRVPDEIEVEGFLAPEASLALGQPGSLDVAMKREGVPRAFHPPSFGVTVLGNSHGFDKNGSTSGYVLWINGRGVMIDPPPYSSATLEREGIRPQMIIGVIVTHCHADHDAGAFQKVLTGSKLSIITTPTIYKSFIRKYAALSGLTPVLLRHSHRHRAAIIGQPLRFQGATFHFTYTLHTIPCLGFKVEWRGRSMVFSGDHLNLPPLIDDLEKSGVLSKGRADDLRQLPLQDCDALLHEAGAPPIHTPLAVLQALPDHVKKRLYVVHTSALPPDCGLRVAPTGTAGTIRLDTKPSASSRRVGQNESVPDSSALSSLGGIEPSSLDDGGNRNLSLVGDYFEADLGDLKKSSLVTGVPPLVYLRPTSISDAWFMLNLLCNVPFFSALSYVSTMEVLEIAKVEVFCDGEVVIPASRRIEALCVVWEGTCVEFEDEMGQGVETMSSSSFSEDGLDDSPTIWYAGDWVGPIALQPDIERSAMKASSKVLCDIVAVSKEGVKVIMLPMKDLEVILKRGSKPYRKYLQLQRKHAVEEEAAALARMRDEQQGLVSSVSQRQANFAFDHLLSVLQCNSVLGNLSALQKRSLESIAEGPRVFESGSTLWKAGDRCNYSFLLMTGTVSFKPQSSGRGSLGGVAEVSCRQIGLETDKLLPEVALGSEYARLESLLESRSHIFEAEDGAMWGHYLSAPRDRFANKVLSRLYASRRFTGGMLFSRGCFLGDTQRMVHGDLVSDVTNEGDNCHSSTMVVGEDNCVAMVFPRTTFIPFLDANPGVLLSLLGTQIVV